MLEYYYFCSLSTTTFVWILFRELCIKTLLSLYDENRDQRLGVGEYEKLNDGQLSYIPTKSKGLDFLFYISSETLRLPSYMCYYYVLSVPP